MDILLPIFFSSLLYLIFFKWHNKNPQKGTGDDTLHFLILRNLRKNFKTHQLNEFLIDNGKFSYPKLFHQLSLLLPQKIIDKYLWLPNFLIVIFFNILFYLSINFFFYHKYFQINYEIILLILVANFRLNLFIKDGVSKAYFIYSERLFASLICSLYFLYFYIFIISMDKWIYIFLIILFMLSNLTSKFSRQLLLFFTFIYGILFNYYALTIIIGGFLLSFIISPVFFLNSIKMQIEHLITYKKYISNSLYMQNNKQKISYNFLNLRFLKSYLKYNNFLYSIFRNPEFYLFFFLCFYFNLDNLIWIYFVIFILNLLTSIKFLNFLGESFRYIEYSSVYLNTVVLLILFNNPNYLDKLDFIYLVSILYVITALMYFFYYRKINYSELPMEEINNLPFSKHDNLFAIPSKYSQLISLNTNCKFLWWQPGNFTRDIYNKLYSDYPYFDLDKVSSLVCKYKISKILINKESLKNKQINYKSDLKTFFPKFSKIYDSENFIIYEKDN